MTYHGSLKASASHFPSGHHFMHSALVRDLCTQQQGLVFMSSVWLLLSLLSRGSGGAQPDSPICNSDTQGVHTKGD